MPKYLLSTFLSFRCKQLFRLLQEIGVLRTILVLSLLVLLLIYSVKRVAAFNPMHLSILYVLSTILVHLFRRDHIFLSHLNVNKRLIYVAEYNVVVVPFSLMILTNGLFWVTLIGHFISTAVAFLPELYMPKYHSKKRMVIYRVPLSLFEWRALFRKYYWIALINYGLGIVLSFSVYILPLLMLFWLSLFAEMYNAVEPKELLEEFSPQKEYIKKKIKLHSLFFHGLLTPHYLLFTLFHYQHWYVMLYVVISSQIILSFCILFKYSHASHGESSVRNQVPVALFSMLTIVLAPLSMVILYNYWKKADAAIKA